MILIYGRMDDPPLSITVEALQEAGAEYVLLEQSALDREELHVEVGPCGVRGNLVASGQDVPLESVHSVYARPLELPSHHWDHAATARARTVHEPLFETLDVAQALVVNRPRTMQANGSEPLAISLLCESRCV